MVLSFEVKTTDVVYTPFSFQHTSKTVTDTGLFMDLIAPGVGWKQNTWQRYQTRIPSSAYANVANIDWSDLGKIIIRRSGVVTGTAEETPGGAVLSFRNWKYTAGIQNIETFDLSTTPALGTVVGLEGETTYVMKVAAYNVAGVAAWSPLSADTATTVPQVPSKAENAPLITFGKTTNDADSFLISWELPYFGGTPITGYKLLMLSRLAQVQLITLNTTVSSLVAGTSGGEFKITIGSTSTPCLAWDASAATVQNALLTNVFQVLTNDHHQPSIEKVSKSQLEMINDEKYLDYSFSRWRIVFGADANVVPLLVASNSGCAAFNDATAVAPAVDIIVTEFQTGNQSASSIITEDTGSVERSLTMTNMLGDSVYSVQFHAINAKGPGEYSDFSLNYTTPKATTPIAVNTVNSTLLSNVSASIAWNDFRAMGSPVTNYAVSSKYVTNEIQRLHVRVNVTDNNHIEGNFSLRWKDKLTACIPVDVSASDLHSVLISDFQWSNIGLEVTRTNHSYSTHNDASYDLTFTNWVGGDVPNVDSGASSTYARVRQWGSTNEVHDVAFEQNDVEKPLSCGQILEVYSTKGNSTFSSLGYVAVKSNGQVVSWGSSQGGAMATLASSLNNGAKQIASTTTAFAVLKYDGSVVSFGNPLGDDGADSSGLAADRLVRKLYSNYHAFVAIGIDGTPTCWGRISSGGDCGSVNATHVAVIVASSTAFCSLSVLGTVNCWGDPLTGGNQAEVATLFSDNARVASLHANRHAFVAVMADTHTIRCWGNSLYGGKCAPSDNMDPTFLLATTPVQQVVGTATAFAAVSKENGRVYTWGDSANGGDVGVGGTGHDNMTSILKLVSNAYSFAALDTAGNVLTWGNAAYDVVSTTSASGTTVTDALTSSSIVDIVGSNAMDFDGKTLCALKKNPSGSFKAYCWGEVVSGGNTIVDDIRGVVLNTGALAAWKTNGTVHAFGNNAYGASIPVDVTGDAFHHSIGHVVASYNGFVAMYNSSTVLSTISSETTNSSISDLQCTGCVPPSSGICKDVYGVCTNRCTNAGAEKGSSNILTMCRNSNSRRDNNAMSQMTVEEIRRGSDGPLLNGNFESDQYNGYRGDTYAAPEYWRGGSNGQRGGPMVVTSGAPNDGVHPSTILNTTAQGLQQYVMLVYPGSWIEQDLLRLPNVGSAVGISFDVARIGTCGNSTTGTALHRLDVAVSSGEAEVQSIVNSRDEYKHLNLASVLDLSTASDTFMRYTTKFYVPASLGDRAVTLRFTNVGTPSPLSEECTLAIDDIRLDEYMYINKVSASTLSYDATNILHSNSKYQFAVQGENIVGWGVHSDPTATIATGWANLPSAPQSVAITVVHPGQVSLSWTNDDADDNGSPIFGWRVETKLSSAGDNEYFPVIESTYNVLQSADIIVGGLLSSPVTYDFRVAAWNQQGLGAYSTAVTNIKIDNTATIPPASLVRPTVQVTGSDTAVLSWSKPFDTIGETATAAHGVFNSNYLSGSELTGYQIEMKRHDVEVQTLNINTVAGFAAAGGQITVGSYALSLTYGNTLETTLKTNCLDWNAPAWEIETVLAKTMTTHEWTTCADQNAICDTAASSVSISSNVTWGKVSVRYVCVAVESSTGHLLFGNSIESDDHTSVGNTFACDAAKFGGSDPCPGQTKVCQILPISIHVSRTTSIDSWISLASMSYDFIFVDVKGGNIPTMSISMTGGNNVACTTFVPSTTTVTMTANRNGTTDVKNTERSDTTFAAEYWHILVANTNNANVLSQQITNLLGYTTYEFRVRAINGVGVGEASEPSFVASTQIPQAPALVDMNSVAVNNVASDQMNLTWTVPRHYGDLITKYELRTQHYRNEMQSVFISSLNLNLGIVSGGYVLRHTYSNGTRQNSTCIDWNANAASITTILKASLAIVTHDASISFTTTNSTTQNYDIDFSNDNAPVGLLEPFENAGCTAFSSDVVLRATPLQTNVPMTALANYDLNISPLEQTYFILLNLLEQTSYRVAITTYNSPGTRGESSTSGWKTTAAATLPGTMVSTPQVDALSATTANVSFITPNMGGIPILGYTCVTVSGTLGPTVTPLNVNALIELPANQCQVTHIARPLGNELKVRPTARVYMTGLEKGTSYRFGVRAYNDVGFANEVGTMSVALSSVVTSTTIPSIPPGLPFTSKNSATYLTVNFQTPIDDGGTAILGYRIYINVDGLTSDHVEYMSNTSDSFGASTSVLVLGLNASSSYTFQIAAINGVGVGPKSLSSDTKTTVLQYSMALYGTDNSTCGPSTTQQTLLENITATEILQHRNRSDVLVASFAEEIPRVPIQLTNAIGSVESNDAERLIDGDNITSWSWVPAPSNVDGQNVTMAYVDFDAGSIVRIETIAVWYGVRDKNSTTTFKFQSKEVPSGSWTDVPASTKTMSSVVPVGATEVDPTASNKLDVVLSAVTKGRYWRLQVISITGLANYTGFAGVSLIPVPNCKGITRISGLYEYEAPLILDKVQTLINNGSYSTDLMAGGMTSTYSDTNVGYLSSVIERPLQTTPVANPEQPTKPYYTHISETYLVLGWIVPESGGTTIVGHSILSRMVQQPEVQRVQTVGASDGTFKLTYATSETSCMPYDVDAPTMLTTLQTEIGALNASYNTNFTIDKTTESTTTTWQLEYGTDMMNATLITATACSGMTGAAAPTSFTVHDGKTLPFTVLTSNTNVQATSGGLGSYNATGLTKGIVYQFKVATIAFTQGPYSVPTEPQETVKTIPSSPTALVVSDSYTTFIVLNWTTPGDPGGRPVSGYVVEMATTAVSGTTSAFSNFVADTGNTKTELLCSGLIASTTYVFRVAAINIMGIGSYSSSISIQTDVPSAPKPPVNIQIDSYYLGSSDNKYNYTVNVTWDTPLYTGGDSITGYKVEVRPVVPEQQIILARSTTSLDDPLGPVGGNGIGGGGQFKISYDGQQANGCLDWNASASDVQTALESLSSLMSLTNVNVQTMHRTNDGVHTMWTVTFLDVFYNLPLLEVSEGINTGPSCASGVDGTSATNTPCKFPFVYQDVTYTDTCRNSGAGGSYNGQGWCPTSSTYPTAGYQWGSCISCTLDNCRAFGNEYTYTDLFDSSNNIAGGSVPNIVVYEGLTGSGSTATVWTVEQLAATSSSTATSIMLPELNFGNRYYVRVSAINSIGTSEPLPSSSYTAMEMSRPLSVDNSTFAVTHATSHMLEMTWNRPVQSRWGGSFVRGYAILVKGNSREDYNGSLHDSNWMLNVKDTMYLGVGAGINSYDGAAATFEQKYQLTSLQAGVDYQLCAVVLSGNTDYNVPSSLAERCNPSEEFYTPLKIPDMPLSLEVLAGTATCSAASATMDLARCRTVQWQTPSSDGGKLIYEYRLYADVSREEMQSVTIILKEAETSSTRGQYKLTLEGVGTTQCLNYDADTATVVTAFADVGVTVVARDHDAGISINGGTETKYFMNIVFTSNGANVVNGDVPLMTMAWGASGCATMTPSYSAIVEEQRKGLSLDGVYNLYATIPSNFTSSAPNVIVAYEGTFNLGQTYSLRMSAVTEMGESNMSTSATTFTTASAASSATPLQEIRDIQYTINTNSIVARWNVLDDGGYYITSYNFDTMIRFQDPATVPAPPVPTVLYLGPVPSSSSGISGSSLDQIQYEHNVTFSGLIIGESYQILIRAESVTGAVAAGTYSEPMRTALSVTDAPPNVPSFVVLSPTEGELSWETPDFVGGSIISGYQLLCQIWFGNQQYIREVQQITSNGTSLTFLAGKVNQQYKIVHPTFTTHAESISTICFDPYATNATNLQTVLNTLGSVVRNGLDVVVSMSATTNATTGAFHKSWSITFNQDLANRPLLTLTTVGCTTASSLASNETHLYGVDVAVDRTTSGVVSRSYNILLNDTSSVSTAFNITNLAKGTTHLFKVAAWNEYGLSPMSLPSEPKTSELIVKITLNGLTVATFDTAAQNSYLTVMSTITGHDVNKFVITNVQNVGSGSRRLMLEGSRNVLMATEDSTVVHSSRVLDGKINVEIQDLSGSVHLYPRRRRLNDAIEVTTVLKNVSVTQGYNAETSINIAVASVEPSTSLVLQLNNASVAVTTATIDSETVVEQAAPAEQPATVADTITATPTTSNVAGSRITLSWTAPVDGGSAIVGYAVWYNATHKQVSSQVVRLMVLFSFAHIF